MTFPLGHPPIPARLREDDVVAIIRINHAKAYKVNQDKRFETQELVSIPRDSTEESESLGCVLFLTQDDQQSSYGFGRSQGQHRKDVDIYIPHANASPKQLTLVADYEANSWRIEANSTPVVIQVNGVPLRRFATATKKRDRLPHTLFLDVIRQNSIEVCDIGVDIWLGKAPKDFLLSDPTRGVSKLNPELQHVQNRSEAWAADRYMLGEAVTTRSFRVTQRFTGEKATAKLFNGQDGSMLRDEEWLMMSKTEVDRSIVRYMDCVAIGGIPAVITSTHEGYVPYEAMRQDIHLWHPGLRFEAATRLMRRLFSALGILHYNKIIYAELTRSTLLLRLRDRHLEDCLLVDYSQAWCRQLGQEDSRHDKVINARLAMELVVDFCQLWDLRSSEYRGFENTERELRNCTEEAKRTYEKVRRVMSYFIHHRGLDRHSNGGRKLWKLLATKEGEWNIARNRQFHNGANRHITPVTAPKLAKLAKQWEKESQNCGIGEKIYMILSLGHQEIDELANLLYLRKWDLTPRDVCAKLRALEGPLEDPWRTFTVKRSYNFKYTVETRGNNKVKLTVQKIDFWKYLSAIGARHPEWQLPILDEYVKIFSSKYSGIDLDLIEPFLSALKTMGTLPPACSGTLEKVAKLRPETLPHEHTFTEHLAVWYHVPSRMFNLTQLLRIATPAKIYVCVKKELVTCDSYAEVRGDPAIQGLYVHQGLLQEFAAALEIDIVEMPDEPSPLPTYDPSDFSQEPHQGRIILARRGMSAYATVIRDGGGQFFHCEKGPGECQTGEGLLKTQFGDMPVLLPLDPRTRKYERPDHWTQFKTLEQLQFDRNYNRKIRLPVAPSARQARPPSAQTAVVPVSDPIARAQTPPETEAPPIDPSSLHSIYECFIFQHHLRTQGTEALKRTFVADTDSDSSTEPPPSRRRRLLNDRRNTSVDPQHYTTFTQAFLDRNPDLQIGPPGDGANSDTALTDVSSWIFREYECKEIGTWLETVSLDGIEDDGTGYYGVVLRDPPFVPPSYTRGPYKVEAEKLNSIQRGQQWLLEQQAIRKYLPVNQPIVLSFAEQYSGCGILWDLEDVEAGEDRCGRRNAEGVLLSEVAEQEKEAEKEEKEKENNGQAGQQSGDADAQDKTQAKTPKDEDGEMDLFNASDDDWNGPAERGVMLGQRSGGGLGVQDDVRDGEVGRDVRDEDEDEDDDEDSQQVDQDMQDADGDESTTVDEAMSDVDFEDTQLIPDDVLDDVDRDVRDDDDEDSQQVDRDMQDADGDGSTTQDEAMSDIEDTELMSDIDIEDTQLIPDDISDNVSQ